MLHARIRVVLVGLVLLGLQRSALANEEESSALVSARAGYALFFNARSLALKHNIKPALRLGALWPVWSRIDLGAQLSAVTANSNYGVWGAYGVGRYRLIDAGFQLNASLGLGVGHDAPILHDSLTTDGTVLPYAYLGLEALFSLGDGWRLGVELADEQLSVLHLGAAVTYSY